MEEWHNSSEIHEGKFLPKMTYNSQNQTHIAQQFRREKLRIPGSQQPVSPQADDESNHTSGSRSSIALPQRLPDPKRAKTVRDLSYTSKFVNGNSGNIFQNAMSDACQAYSTEVVPSDSFNFPIGAELLDVSARKMTQTMALAGSGYNHQSVYTGDVPSNSNRSSNPSNWGLGLHGQVPQHGPAAFYVGLGTRNFQNPLNNDNQAAVEAILVGTNLQSTDSVTRNKELVMEPYMVHNNQSEALQLCGVNLGYHGYTEPVEGNMVLIGRSPGGTMENHQSIGNHERHVAGIQVPLQSLSHAVLPHQATVAVIPIVEQAFPSNFLSSRLESQSSSNWPNGGNELLFLPIPEHTESNQAGTTSTNQTLDFGRTTLWSPPDYEIRNSLMMQRQGQALMQGEVGHSLHVERQEDPNPGHFQGLSLSLSSHQPSGMQLNSFPVQIPNSGLASNATLIPHAVPDGKLDLVDGFSNKFHVGLNMIQTPRDILLSSDLENDNRKDNSSARQFGYSPGVTTPNHFRMLSSCKYLKIVQHLLDELCSVGKDGNSSGSTELKHHDSMTSKSKTYGSIQNERADSGLIKQDSTSLNVSGTAAQCSEAVSILTQEERQNMQIRKTQLLSMLQEVDRKYQEYYDHMQAVIFLFDSSVGQVGAARPYTRLALKAMSKHFRCLRDTITNQVQITCKALGEEGISDPGPLKKVKSRLRFVDQQLRQQRALQQLGMLQQPAWRPQRGLPEHSVSILRAWLFEHFLHPYPKDADKMLLARQTGLSRSQVSNWFINARVRLWKPMVEEMYLEENREHEHDREHEHEHEASAKQMNHQADDGMSCEQSICDNRDGNRISRSGIVREEIRNIEGAQYDGKSVTGSSRHHSNFDTMKSENKNVIGRMNHVEMTNDHANILGSNFGTSEHGIDKDIDADMPFKQFFLSYNPASLSSSVFDKTMQPRSKDTLSDTFYQDDYKVGNMKRYSTYPFTVQNGNAFISHSVAPDTYAINDGSLNLYTQMDVPSKLFENGVSLTLGLQHANNFTQATSHNYIHSLNNLTGPGNGDEFHSNAIKNSGGMHSEHIEGHESITFQSRKCLPNYSVHEFVA